MGETRVDLQHLLEDLRDAYTGSLEETIVTEIIANSLDAGTAVALALAPLAVTPTEEHLFVTRFLAEWGNLSVTRARRGAPRPRPSRSR